MWASGRGLGKGGLHHDVLWLVQLVEQHAPRQSLIFSAWSHPQLHLVTLQLMTLHWVTGCPGSTSIAADVSRYEAVNKRMQRLFQLNNRKYCNYE